RNIYSIIIPTDVGQTSLKSDTGSLLEIKSYVSLDHFRILSLINLIGWSIPKNWKKAKDTFDKHNYKYGLSSCLNGMLFMDKMRLAYEKGVKIDLTKAYAEKVMIVIMDEIRGRKFLMMFFYLFSCTNIALKEYLVDMLSSHNLNVGASCMKKYIFDFVFIMHVMLELLGMIDILLKDMDKEINVRVTSTCGIQKVTTCIYYHFMLKIMILLTLMLLVAITSI
ncbi:hypothetical protein ACJX0J_009887, partial [Zea mays]